MSVAVPAGTVSVLSAERGVAPRWPLLALTVLAAALRFSTLGRQSLWYDEAFTPVHVLHPSLGATLHAVVHTENTPPLWYMLEWGVSRVLGTGPVALRLISALAGVATVPVGWAIGRELSSQRAALACAAIVAVNPLFVWYSQEARAYSLFVLFAALAMVAGAWGYQQHRRAARNLGRECVGIDILRHHQHARIADDGRRLNRAAQAHMQRHHGALAEAHERERRAG